jgi:hypothetical protein
MLVALATSGLGCTRAVNGSVEREIEEIRRVTLPGDASGATSASSEHRPWSVRARWEFRTEKSWHEYGAWLEVRLPGGFEPRARDEGSALFVRQLPGDVHRLEVRATEEPPRLLVEIVFEAMPF